MFVHGLARAHSQLHPDAPGLLSPPQAYEFGLPEPFVPQKVRAIRRAKQIVRASLVVAALLAIGVLTRLVF